jgi:hypothetical protein
MYVCWGYNDSEPQEITTSGVWRRFTARYSHTHVLAEPLDDVGFPFWRFLACSLCHTEMVGEGGELNPILNLNRFTLSQCLMITVDIKMSITENLCVRDCTCVYDGGRYRHEASCLRTISIVRLTFLPHNLHCQETFYVFYINLTPPKCVHFIRCKERHAATSLRTSLIFPRGIVQ